MTDNRKRRRCAAFGNENGARRGGINLLLPRTSDGGGGFDESRRPLLSHFGS